MKAFIRLLPVLGLLIGTVGCLSQTETAATPAAASGSVPEGKIMIGAQEIPVSGFEPAAADPAAAPTPAAPVPDPTPVVEHVKQEAGQAVGTLDQGVKKTAAEIKGGVDQVEERAEGLIQKAEHSGKDGVRDALRRAKGEFSKEIGTSK